MRAKDFYLCAACFIATAVADHFGLIEAAVLWVRSCV